MIKRIKVHTFEKGLFFREGEFVGIREAGKYWLIDPLRKRRIDVVSMRTPWIEHEKLDVIVKSGALAGMAEVLEIADRERALVWIDGRFDRVLTPGLYALWTGFRKVRVERVPAESARFTHRELARILKSAGAALVLDSFIVQEGHVGVVIENGVQTDVVKPGVYAFWKNVATVKLLHLDMREKMLDVTGQDIMTQDKVTLRMNAVVTYRVTNVETVVKQLQDPDQSLYREAQLALRTVVGEHSLDELLGNKALLGDGLRDALAKRASDLGVELIGVGIRDVILPGDMRELLNKVTEAKKAAEANLIQRREETAAMRSQVNTARLLEDNPTLMRLRELETLATIAEKADLKVVLGEKGLADRVVNLL